MKNNGFTGDTESYFNNMKTAGQWLTETSSNFLSNYTKQMSIASDMFTNSVVKEREIGEAIIKAYDQQAALFMDFNRIMLDLLARNNQGNENFADKNNEFQKNIENQFQSSREAVKTIVDLYSKMASSFSESKIEILSKMNDQINFLAKTNLNFWSQYMDSTFNSAHSSPPTA